MRVRAVMAIAATACLLAGCAKVDPDTLLSATGEAVGISGAATPGSAASSSAAPTRPSSAASAAAPVSSATPSASGCTYTPAGEPARAVEPPSVDGVERSGEVAMTIVLDGKPVQMLLNRAKAPCAVNAVISLATQGFYTKTSCHRLSTSGVFYLQCGDRSETGTGDGGYSYPIETSGQSRYPAGTVVMAPADNHNGSQFLIIWKDTQLKGDYTVIGRTDDAGLRVVTQIAARGADANGKPVAPAVISSVIMG